MDLFRVLLIDDDDEALRFISFVFEHLQMIATPRVRKLDIRTARSGNEGLDLVNNGFTPGLVVTDLIMPGLYGTDVAEALKPLRAQGNTICVVMLTAYASTLTPRIIEESGCHLTLHKGANPKDMVSAIIKVCPEIVDPDF